MDSPGYCLVGLYVQILGKTTEKPYGNKYIVASKNMPMIYKRINSFPLYFFINLLFWKQF